jgi:O-antigen/teichoic acid export membrane protein
MTVASTMYTNLDNVMVGFIATDTDVGYYGAAVKIKTILVSIVTSLGTVLLPRASYYIEHGEITEFKRITEKALNFVFLLATPLMIYFILFAKEGIFFLSGNAYAGSILPMQIIMPTLLFIGLSNIIGIQMLVPLGKEKVVLYSTAAGALVDLAINALLIPRFTSIGAAIGTLAAEFVVLVWQYIALKDRLIENFKKIPYFQIVVALVCSAIASIWIKRLGFGSFVTLAMSAVLFFGVYFGTLLLFKESLTVMVVNQILKKFKKKN